MLAEPSFPAVRRPPARLQLQLESPPSDSVRQFVQARFAEAHHAEVHQLLPQQLVLRAISGRLLACAGMRPAETGALYLEHYLDLPIEQQIASQLRQPVARKEILEIGNLAALPGQARWLILAMTRYLAGREFRFVTFTATDQVRAAFAHLGLPLLRLARAERERVPDPQRWGGYYQHSPEVMMGDIRQGLTHLNRVPLLAQLMASMPDESPVVEMP